MVPEKLGLFRAGLEDPLGHELKLEGKLNTSPFFGMISAVRETQFFGYIPEIRIRRNLSFFVQFEEKNVQIAKLFT